MRDPFIIDEPTCISFSGGRTSAYMLWRVLQSNNGLPDDAIVCFANTGKEDEATLQFVHDCETQWNINIHWLEFTGDDPKYKVVNFESAARNGEPFEKLIHLRKMLPNVRARFCTAELKIRTMSRFTKSIGINEYQNLIGIRADEERRAVRMKPDSNRESVRMPLHEAGIKKQDVLNFWKENNFDLDLPIIDGETIGGNCDLCFLKSMPKIITLVKQNPEKAIWWAKMEDIGASYTNGNGSIFSLNRPKYSQIHKYLDKQIDMFSNESMECFCGD
jgi:3'-phosphoadenosine 5'-phosphosulfate sulfotransferase (PAPS reductase)/FAD synthetase